MNPKKAKVNVTEQILTKGYVSAKDYFSGEKKKKAKITWKQYKDKKPANLTLKMFNKVNKTMEQNKAKKAKVVKAWYVDLPYLRKLRHFSGSGYGFRARIFPTRKAAKESGFDNPIIIPCEIHYKLPTKRVK